MTVLLSILSDHSIPNSKPRARYARVQKLRAHYSDLADRHFSSGDKTNSKSPSATCAPSTAN